MEMFASATSSFAHVPRPPGSGLPNSEQLFSKSRLQRLQSVEQPYIAPQPPYMHYEEMKRHNSRLEQDIRRLKLALKQERRERESAERSGQQRAADMDLARRRTQEAWEADVARVRDECDKLVASAKDDKSVESNLLDELSSLQEKQRLMAEQEKEARIELLKGQAMRRIANRDIAAGFSAWLELWEAKKYALARLRECGNRLKSPELYNAFSDWHTDFAEAKRARLAAAAAARELELLNNKGVVEAELTRIKAECEAKVNAAHAEKAAALERQRVELVGTAEERAAMLEAQGREERIELMKRQMVRRIMNRDISLGFGAWVELWEAKTYAMGRLRSVGNRLKSPELADAFSYWRVDLQTTQSMSLLEQQQSEKNALQAERDGLSAELARVRGEFERTLAAAEEERRVSLERLRVQLSGSVEEQQRMLEEQEKEAREERIQLLRRQMVRRIMNRDIALGFGAWVELWIAKVDAMDKLRAVGNKLRSPELSNAFDHWAVDFAADKSAKLAAASMSHAQQLELSRTQVAKLEADLYQLQGQLQGVMAEKRAFAEMVDNMKGTHAGTLANLEGQQAQMEAKAREERIELMKRQMVRRIMNRDIALGFGAWRELWQAKTYAMARLRECGNRLKSPELYNAFSDWHGDWFEAKRIKMLEEARLQELEVQDVQATIEKKIAIVRAEAEKQLAEAEKRMDAALERQRIELVGTAEERLALRKSQDKEERVEMMRRQAIRRIQQKDLTLGFSCWTDMWESRRYALSKLQSVANKMKAPEVTNAFNLWYEDLDMAKRAAENTAIQRTHARLEFEISQSKNECGELKMVVLARDDELHFLKHKHDSTVAALAQRDATIAELVPQCDKQAAQIEELLRQLTDANAAKVLSEKAQEDARLQMITQNESNRSLLEQLLAEQRATFEDDFTALREKISKFGEERKAESEAFKERSRAQSEAWDKERAADREAVAKTREADREAAQADLDKERESFEKRAAEQKEILEAKIMEARASEATAEAERKATSDELIKTTEQRDAFESELQTMKLKFEDAEKLAETSAEAKERFEMELADAVQDLAKVKAALKEGKEDMATLKAALAAAEKKLAVFEKKKADSPLKKSMMALQEANPGAPISQILGLALKKNAARVIDLFRQWDTDGDGEVSRPEFHKAMPALGLGDLEKADIDELFNTWDADGGGSLDFKELSTILKGSGAAKLQAAGAAVGALKALSKK